MLWTADSTIMRHARQPLQSSHAGIRREAGRVRTLRNHDGRAPRTPGCDHGHDHRRHGAGRTARRLLPEPALAGASGDGYSDGDEEFDRREGVDPERDGAVEENSLTGRGAGAL